MARRVTRPGGRIQTVPAKLTCSADGHVPASPSLEDEEAFVHQRLCAQQDLRRSLIDPSKHVFQVVQAGFPEPGHPTRPVDEGRQRAANGAVMRLAALVSITDEAGLFQHAEVLRDRRLRYPGAGGERSDGLLSIPAEPLEDGSTGWICEGSEESVVRLHEISMTSRLWVDSYPFGYESANDCGSRPSSAPL